MIQLRKTSFRKWLAEHSDDAVAGLRGRCSKCPVAEFVASQGGEDPTVLPPQVEFYENGSYIYRNTPDWVINFVAKVDCSDAPSSEITASEALAILDSI